MKFLITSILIFISVLLLAQGGENTTIGNKAPDFSLKTMEGNEIRLSELIRNQPVVLVVLRGWPEYQCPVCTRQVGNLVNDEHKFADLGAAVIMVYPDPSGELLEHAEEFSQNFRFPENFHFLLDPDYTMINLYGLRWDAPMETAYPSTFVINKEGKIVYSKISTSHGGRADNDEILNVLNDLYGS